MTDAIIDVHDIVFRYPDGTRALDGLSLHVGEGERVAVFAFTVEGFTGCIQPA